MARTFQQVIDRARIPLNDADKVRYPDDDLLAGANDAILILRRERPDLFFGTYLNPIPPDYATDDEIPIGDEYFVPLWHYVVAWAEYRDDEDAMQQRAQSFMAMFIKEY